MRASIQHVHSLLLLAVAVSQVKSLTVDVPTNWERRCEIPATVTRDSDSDPEVFALAYVEDDLQFTEVIATPTDTGLTPQTVIFQIASPGIFHLELTDESNTAAILATSTPFTLSDSIDPCPTF